MFCKILTDDEIFEMLRRQDDFHLFLDFSFHVKNSVINSQTRNSKKIELFKEDDRHLRY